MALEVQVNLPKVRVFLLFTVRPLEWNLCKVSRGAFSMPCYTNPLVQTPAFLFPWYTDQLPPDRNIHMKFPFWGSDDPRESEEKSQQHPLTHIFPSVATVVKVETEFWPVEGVVNIFWLCGGVANREVNSARLQLLSGLGLFYGNPQTLFRSVHSVLAMSLSDGDGTP